MVKHNKSTGSRSIGLTSLTKLSYPSRSLVAYMLYGPLEDSGKIPIPKAPCKSISRWQFVYHKVCSSILKDGLLNHLTSFIDSGNPKPTWPWGMFSITERSLTPWMLRAQNVKIRKTFKSTHGFQWQMSIPFYWLVYRDSYIGLL